LFKPYKPYLISTWITLRLLSLEFSELTIQIASAVGWVLLRDDESLKTTAPQFCVGLDISQGWVASIAIPNIQSEDAVVLVEFDSIQHMRCRCCWDLSHSEISCPSLWNPMSRAQVDPTIPHSTIDNQGQQNGGFRRAPMQQYERPQPSPQQGDTRSPQQHKRWRRPPRKYWQRPQPKVDDQGFTLVQP
jgi:hypothetical protein